MKKILVFLILTVSTTAFSQDYQKEINEQIWKPFTQAIMNQNVDQFITLHSKDLVRAEINSKKVYGYDEYKREMELNWPKWKENLQVKKSQYTFELRFTERIANENTAYEIGYFKNEVVSSAGEKRISYGKFHVVLRKENGAWKVLVDSDSNEGGNITEEMFQSAKPLS